MALYTKKPLLIVLDANSYWTEQLFSNCTNHFDVLLLKPREIRAYKKLYGRYLSDKYPNQLSKGLWEFTISLPSGWMFQLWQIVKRYLVWKIRNFIKGRNIIFVFNYPQYHTILSDIKASLSIYYNTDDYSDHWPINKKKVEIWEREAVKDVDLVICIAQERMKLLQKRHIHRESDIYHVPIGVTSFEMVDKVLLRSESLPPLLNNLSRPVVGHIGALNWRFDYAFMYEVAYAMPEANFVLGGELPNVDEGANSWWDNFLKIKKLKNVQFIGHVNRNELSNFLKSFDALMIIYSDNRFNRNACPAKLWDYLGTSLPIVSNDVVPEIRLWKNYIKVEATPQGFVKALNNVLKENRSFEGERRLKVAKEHTWDKLAEVVTSIINQRI